MEDIIFPVGAGLNQNAAALNNRPQQIIFAAWYRPLLQELSRSIYYNNTHVPLMLGRAAAFCENYILTNKKKSTVKKRKTILMACCSAIRRIFKQGCFCPGVNQPICTGSECATLNHYFRRPEASVARLTDAVLMATYDTMKAKGIKQVRSNLLKERSYHDFLRSAISNTKKDKIL